MNIDTMKFGFEPVELIPVVRHKRNNEVWLAQGDKGKYNQVYISIDVADKLDWKDGTRLELMKSRDGKTLAFRAVEHGASFEIKYRTNSAIRINSSSLARTMRALIAVKYGANSDVNKFSVQAVDDIAILTPEFDEL